MPRADELEHGDRIRLPYDDRIVEVVEVNHYWNRVTIFWRSSIGGIEGHYTTYPHRELEDCS